MEMSDYVDATKYPTVNGFMKDAVDLQIADLRVLLQLPRGELTAGCNFAATALLCNLISGLSTCLYDAVRPSKIGNTSGKRFKDLLKNYYPWSLEPKEQEYPGDKGYWLYKQARNPFAHNLGIRQRAVDKAEVAKRPLNVAEITSLETQDAPPTFLRIPTLSVWCRDDGNSVVALSVPSLYWGVWRMVEKLCRDDTQMAKAESMMRRL